MIDGAQLDKLAQDLEGFSPYDILTEQAKEAFIGSLFLLYSGEPVGKPDEELVFHNVIRLTEMLLGEDISFAIKTCALISR